MSPQKTPSNVTSAQHQPKGPTSQSSLEESTYRSVRIEARQTQGIPGEFLAAYSPQADKIYVTGIFNFTPEHGSTVATIARVNPQTLQIEATAKMQVLEENHTKLAGQYQFRGAFGIDVDDEHGTLWVTDASSYTVAVYRQEDLGAVAPLSRCGRAMTLRKGFLSRILLIHAKSLLILRPVKRL